MGNRGILHDDQGRLVQPWRHDAWIICRTKWKGRRRSLMTPNRYTELFFLDEVHALAAGHRPCFECRHEAAVSFRERTGLPNAGAIDRRLAAERLMGRRGQRRSERRMRRHREPAHGVPSGSMVLVGHTVFARRSDGFVVWSQEHPAGYLAELSSRARRDADRLWAIVQSRAHVDVLTPPLSRMALAAGYEPHWHASVDDAAVIA